MAQNIAYQDIAGGSIKIYKVNQHLPRVERIKTALKELEHVGCIKIFLYKRRKFRVLRIKGY